MDSSSDKEDDAAENTDMPGLVREDSSKDQPDGRAPAPAAAAEEDGSDELTLEDLNEDEDVESAAMEASSLSTDDPLVGKG